MSTRVRLVTYNVHKCRGLDRRTRPDRVAEVLRSLDADVIALQEVIGAGPRSPGHAQALGAMLGMGWTMAVTREYAGHHYGNVVLSCHPIVHQTQCDLTWKTCEPRCCQRVTVRIDGRELHVFNVHLGTAVLERRYQAGRLAAFVQDRRVEGPKVLLGDFNEWFSGRASALLSSAFKSVDLQRFLHRRRTYPAIFPVTHLDRIYYEGPLEIAHVTIPRTRTSLIASDHVPIVADFRLTA